MPVRGRKREGGRKEVAGRRREREGKRGGGRSAIAGALVG
jgi:hypothetical protein